MFVCFTGFKFNFIDETEERRKGEGVGEKGGPGSNLI